MNPGGTEIESQTIFLVWHKKWNPDDFFPPKTYCIFSRPHHVLAPLLSVPYQDHQSVFSEIHRLNISWLKKIKVQIDKQSALTCWLFTLCGPPFSTSPLVFLNILRGKYSCLSYIGRNQDSAGSHNLLHGAVIPAPAEPWHSSASRKQCQQLPGPINWHTPGAGVEGCSLLP